MKTIEKRGIEISELLTKPYFENGKYKVDVKAIDLRTWQVGTFTVCNTTQKSAIELKPRDVITRVGNCN